MPTESPFHQPTEQFSNEEYWRQYIADHGVVATRAHAKQMRAGPAGYAREALLNHLKEQEISRYEREIETLEISKKTLSAVQEGNATNFWVLVVLVLTMLVTIATCTAS